MAEPCPVKKVFDVAPGIAGERSVNGFLQRLGGLFDPFLISDRVDDLS